jgi:hypothetical protein
MPGNETTSKSPKSFLPAQWTKEGFTAGQAVGVAMEIRSFPASINEMSLLRKTSLLTVAIILSAAPTAGLIRFELTKNGVDTGKTFDMTSVTGARQVWEFRPGELTGVKGDRVGIKWGSSGTLTPSGTIDGVVLLEVQDA